MDQLSINNRPFDYGNLLAKPVIKVAQFSQEQTINENSYPNPGGLSVDDGLVTRAPDPGFTIQLLANSWLSETVHEFYFMAQLPIGPLIGVDLFWGDIRHQAFTYTQQVYEELILPSSVTVNYDHLSGGVSVSKNATAAKVWIELRIRRTFQPNYQETIIPAGVTFPHDHIPLYVGTGFPGAEQPEAFQMRLHAWQNFSLANLVVAAGKYTQAEYLEFIPFSTEVLNGKPLKVYFVDAQKTV